ncbi:MAG: FlgD immunoglobulin-like domain containing protein, partial [Flavisolibacter sp.]
SEKWQFALMNNDEGVALERIDPNDSSQKQSNWHSAASTAGYGTPTYKNSQYKQTNAVNAAIDISPKVFSPDNDGHDDIATINYQVTEPGYVANVSIFDANGRMVRYLAKNSLLGLKGSWNWDGLGENGQRLAIGTYIVFTEIFNLQGRKQQFKNTVVLARKLN